MEMFAARIRQRKVVQWALGYLASAWVFLQVMQLIGDSFGWPVVFSRILIVLAAAGFVATVILAWFHGDRGRQRATTAELLMLAALEEFHREAPGSRRRGSSARADCDRFRPGRTTHQLW